MSVNWMEYRYNAPNLQDLSAGQDLNEIKNLDVSKKSAAYIAFKAKFPKEFAEAREKQEGNVSNFLWLIENLNSKNRDLVIPALRTYHGKPGYCITKDPGTGILDFKIKVSEALDIYQLYEGG